MRRILLLFVIAGTFVAAAMAQQQPRVFITDSNSWEVAGSAGGTGGSFGGHSQGGARPQTAEIIKTFGERCPNAVVNNKQDKADYVVVLDHEGGKGWISKDNKVAVFNADGDSIMSHSTRSLGASVQDACAAITKDWEANGSKRKEKATAAQSNPTPAEASQSSGKVAIASQPTGADIEVDGSFVGNTPSALNLTPGEHVIVVKKSGYKDWERKIKYSGGEINLSPELEKVQ